eukprot:scaffold4423_cov159-Skeletonema_menzelii.AAC.12
MASNVACGCSKGKEVEVQAEGEDPPTACSVCNGCDGKGYEACRTGTPAASKECGVYLLQLRRR